MKLYKKIISVFLAGTLVFTGIHFSKINKKIETKAEPFGKQHIVRSGGHMNDQSFGLCIDEGMTLGGGDVMQNVMHDLDESQYGTDAYNQVLETNVQILRNHGIDESNVMQLFWTGVSIWKTTQHGKGDNPDGLRAANYWYDQSIEAAKYSIANGYMPNIGNLNYAGLVPDNLKNIRRGDRNFPQFSANKPLLQYLGNNETFMGEKRISNYPNVNAVMPRLSNAWKNSYGLTKEKSGGGLWTANSYTDKHFFTKAIGTVPKVSDVQTKALDMRKDPNYKKVIRQPRAEEIDKGANPVVLDDSSSSSNSSSNNSSMDKDESDYDNDSESDDEVDDEKTNESGKSSNTDLKKYYINMNGYFIANSGPLMVWSSQNKSWVQFDFYMKMGTSIVVDGWEIKYVDDSDGARLEFTYIAGDEPTGLTMYFDIPSGAITAEGSKTYEDPMHFAATYLNVYECIKKSSYKPHKDRQTFISFKENNETPFYPAYTLGDPISPNIKFENIEFKIYRHTEDWTSHYNVKLEKKDYETDKPLQGANFSLYERFDDKEKINQENDGNKELYLGIKETENKQWQSGYLSSPVIWDNFRKVFNTVTDNKGIISKTIEKKYHYEKTFCNGHPAPEFKAVPEPEYEEDENGNQKEEASNQDEIDEAKEINKQLAKDWITYYEEDIKMAEERKGVHFHWLMNGVDEGKIREIAETGGEEGETPNAGPTEGASIEESFKNSNCKEDCKGTYDKFINLKYSYTWIETKARDGYIRHDNHTDDVPIEVITTNSSEGGAKSEFSNLYSRNIEINDVESNNKNISIPKIPQIINSYENIYMDAFNKAFNNPERTGGSKVKLGKKNIYSHINDKNSEMNKWRIYDHRTEGEIHFNKKDLYLKNKENNLFNSYGIANGDSSLQGAVYGLFASEDIIHPDGKTGVVYKKGDLVSIGTTDRNGNGSFMTFTEKPGTRYNYKTGLTYETDWTNEAPENNFDLNKKDSYADTDSSMNTNPNLRNTHFYVDDYTEDSTYKNGKTERIYDDNKGNNGNSWIGRPLILGEYYIKELSRSEGYELSIGNKNNDITNFGQDENAENKKEAYKGKVNVTTKTYIDPQNQEFGKNEILFNVTSKDTGNLNHGYDVVIDNLPENAIINRVDYITRPEEMEVPDGYEEVPAFYDENGNLTDKDTGRPAYKIAESDKSNIKLNSDGTPIAKTADTNYRLDFIPVINSTHNFDDEKIDEILKGEEKTEEINGETKSYYEMERLLSNEFVHTSGQKKRVKALVEKILRTANIKTPSVKNDRGFTEYSSELNDVYSKGIRVGEYDTFGIAGKKGQNAEKDAYGEQIFSIYMNRTINGKNVTAKQVVDKIIDWYKENNIWNFGGIDDIYLEGNKYRIDLYASMFRNEQGFATNNSDTNNTTIYKVLYLNPLDLKKEPHKVYVPYKKTKTNGIYGTYSDFSLNTSTNKDLVTATIYPDVEISRNGTLSNKKIQDYEYYRKGEFVLDKDGNKIRLKYRKEKTKKEVSDAVFLERTQIPATYKDGKYTFHVTLPYTINGETINDINELTMKFAVTVPEAYHTLTEDDMKFNTDPDFTLGQSVMSGEYEVVFKDSNAFAYLNVEEKLKNAESSYIKEVKLTYVNDYFIFQDGDKKPTMGTIRNPIEMVNRPIGQQVKIIKNIGTENNSYQDNTYKNSHKDNFKDYLNTNTKSTDWLTKLENNEVNNESTKSIPNFMFKMYLKSNLERLYRDENGNITWVDRNGNPLVPEYVDTNNDGNFDTFIWKNGNTEIDFPEENNGNVKSSNVQKIYTEVSHRTGTNLGNGSVNTSDIGNNVFAHYNSPQGGNKNNVGILRQFSTSLNGENGNSIFANSSLFSYNGNNVDTKQTNKLNVDKNNGYTRLLETIVNVKNDGVKTRYVEEYNYEKFFDAINSANEDKWDNDMYVGKNTNLDNASEKNTNKKHSSIDLTKKYPMENYPGQHWFDTFNQIYQLDDVDTDHTLENTDGIDKDNTAKGDKNTSFKPFAWIKENIFGNSENDKNKYPVIHNNENTENGSNTSDKAKYNSQASDKVRDFAIKWYLNDEVNKLIKNNGNNQNESINGNTSYQDEIYDEALFNALKKAYYYLKPFYDNDLDTIYSVVIDSEQNGGDDKDITTLNANKLDQATKLYYNTSVYLPYGDYIVVEQEPTKFENKHYTVQKPQEISVPTVYKENTEELNDKYNYDSRIKPDGEDGMTGKYQIRFNEEISENKREDDDERNYVIRSHNASGDFEVYKYGLDIDRLSGNINYNGGSYNYKGFMIAQDEKDPLKDYYNTIVDSKQNGGNENAHYLSDDKNTNVNVASGQNYYAITRKDNDFVDTEDTPTDYLIRDINSNHSNQPIEVRYHYGSVSENTGIANNVVFNNGNEKNDNNPTGIYYKDNVKTLTGNITIYDGKYASALVPYTIVADNANDYGELRGFANVHFKNEFTRVDVSISKIDAETNENIIGSNATFNLYSASRYQSQDEINEDAKNFTGNEKTSFLENTKVGSVRFYLKDTEIQGSKEFLEGMGAKNIRTVERDIVKGQIRGRYDYLLSQNATNIKPINENDYVYELVGTETELKEKGAINIHKQEFGSIGTVIGKPETNSINVRIKNDAECTGEIIQTRNYLNYIGATDIKEINGYTGVIKGTQDELNAKNAKEIQVSEEDSYIATVTGTREYLEGLGAFDIHTIPNGEYEGSLRGTEEYLQSLATATNIVPSGNPIYRGIVEGTKTELERLNAQNITQKNAKLYTGIVPKGTPIAYENEQIILLDKKGSRTGLFKSFDTTGDVNIVEANKMYGKTNETIDPKSKVFVKQMNKNGVTVKGDKDYLDSVHAEYLYTAIVTANRKEDLLTLNPLYINEIEIESNRNDISGENNYLETKYAGAVVGTENEFNQLDTNKFTISKINKSQDTLLTLYRPKTNQNQNVGHVKLPRYLGAGAYVIVEVKTPSGYNRSKPTAFEIYSDGIHYYNNGNMTQKVRATTYKTNNVLGEETSTIDLKLR